MSIQPKKFAHVVYRTRRFEEKLKWYDEHHRFAFANMTLIQPEGTETDKRGVIGVDHVAYTYASLGDLFENYAHLNERGIAPYWCIHHGITVSMYYAHPDGNQVEFQVEAFKTNELNC